METAQQVDRIASSSVDQSSSNATSSSESDEDFQPPSMPASLVQVKIPDRGAMFVVGAVAQGLGHDLEDMALSRNTIRIARIATRKTVATTEQSAFMPDSPLLRHWDGKLLPDIAGSKKVVDRVAIIATGADVEQLLAVNKIGRGTGEEQCNACLHTLADW